MAFEWVGRTDDDWAWSWDARDSAVRTDNFGLVYPNRLARAAEMGRTATRTRDTQVGYGFGEDDTGFLSNWTKGAPLYVNDPSGGNYVAAVVGSGQAVAYVGATDMTTQYDARTLEGRTGYINELVSYLEPYPSGETHPLWNVTPTARFANTDVNGTVPTVDHIGQQASWTLTVDNDYVIDITGSGDLEITGINTARGWFIVKFLNIQDVSGA